MNVRRLIVTGAGLITLAAPIVVTAPSALADGFIPTGSAGTGSSGIDDAIGATGSAGLTQTGSAGGTFKNCDEARAAGRAPLFRGEPGYSPHLDPDGTGMACPTV
ncbi:excalibur calcium-binding domain-containing protein [Nocardia africana]|uniref:Excalibur calcium-binding domain n=1 Tax=Nocardia africana TaxID=134964 RepID=A0A378X0Z9_9NOCA|nr:excalibur calcium-binding domain-containing protein [Nocardia africana]MCC3311454.1 excalibur calcium-binding domain-containing protein [Nocardia africana]SUA47286.1 Excalibur calcium-binding domain [Nocardia africana]